jgi:transcriptional regulator with XRE-family HTH domain
MIAQPTFGSLISDGRKKKQITQKELAALIKREDGVAISPQYLNDIEHDRRSPSSDFLVKQFAKILSLDSDYLYFLAGRIPTDIASNAAGPERVQQAMIAFRRKLNESKK